MNNFEIHPGESLGKIKIDGKIDSVIDEIHEDFRVVKDNGIATLNEGEIIIGFDDEGVIYSVIFNTLFSGKYKGKLWPGMSVEELISCTKKQIACGGCVIVDDEDGIGLLLPEGYDDFELITDHLPLNYRFEYISIFRPLNLFKKKK